MVKICIVCMVKFNAKGRDITCSTKCSKKNKANTDRIHKLSEKGKETRTKYYMTANGIESRKRERQSLARKQKAEREATVMFQILTMEIAK